MMLMWGEVKTLLRAVLHWWWVVVLATALAGGTAFYLSKFETRYYQARASLMIGNTLTSSLPDQNQLGIGSSLARYYGEVAKREPILSPVVEQLKLPFDWRYLSDYMLQTNVVPSANLLEVTVTDTNPERAAAIANAIGEGLIALSPNSPEKIQTEQAAVEQQIADSDRKIQQLKSKLAEVTAQRDKAQSASDQAEFNNQISQLNLSIGQEEDTYRSLLSLKNTSVVNSLAFFERAATPNTPLPSKRLIAVGAATLAGFLLALLAIFVLDRVDRRWTGRRDLEDRFNLADLGNVPSGPPIAGSSGESALAREQAVREVHTNIMLAAPNGAVHSLMISSPRPNQDRTAFAIDLAHIFARSGHRVLVVDADLTTPNLTKLLLPDESASSENADRQRDDIWARLQPTAIPNVALLPSTIAETGQPALVPSMRWPYLVEQLQSAADVVIFDGPSALSSADAALLAPHVDGAVLVVSPKQDEREDVSKSKARLTHKPNAHLLGAVTLSSQKSWEVAAALKQLTADPIAALPPAGGTGNGSDGPPPEDGDTVIITPPPDIFLDDDDEPAATIEQPAGEGAAASRRDYTTRQFRRRSANGTRAR